MSVFVSFETRVDQPDKSSLYLADVGFGSMRFTKPLLISESHDSPYANECQDPNYL